MVNFDTNQAVFRAAYMNDIYANQNKNSSDSRTNPPLNDLSNKIGQGRDERDIAIISEEARRLQYSTNSLGAGESSLDQQRDISIPGQGQTELHPQAGLEPRREISTTPPTMDQPETEAEAGLDMLDQLELQGQAGPSAIETPAAEQQAAKNAESDNFQQRLQDLTRSTAANINSVNSSSMVQAYASAANVTQASMIVNHKV